MRKQQPHQQQQPTNVSQQRQKISPWPTIKLEKLIIFGLKHPVPVIAQIRLNLRQITTREITPISIRLSHRLSTAQAIKSLCRPDQQAASQKRQE
jgi:hypothetical protein